MGLWDVGTGTGVYARSSNVTESKLVISMIKAVKARYPEAVVVKLHGGHYQRAGVPDIVIICNGITLWVEVKRPGGDTTALQQRNLLNLRNNGAYCGVAESVDELLGMLKTAFTFDGGLRSELFRTAYKRACGKDYEGLRTKKTDKEKS